MEKQGINLNWKENMLFETTVNGHKVIVDAAESVGGTDKAPRPKPLMLVALAGCTAMDVVSLLKKMRIEFSNLQVSVDAELTDEHPKVYTKVHITYSINTNEGNRPSVEKAVKLSQEKYCGVGAMFKKFSDLTYEIKIIP